MISAHAALRWVQRIDARAEQQDIQEAIDRARPVPACCLPYLEHLHIIPRDSELHYDPETGALLVIGVGVGYPRQLVTVLLVSPGIRTLIGRELGRPPPVAHASAEEQPQRRARRVHQAPVVAGKRR